MYIHITKTMTMTQKTTIKQGLLQVNHFSTKQFSDSFLL